jgi:GINS complex subunit 1
MSQTWHREIKGAKAVIFQSTNQLRSIHSGRIYALNLMFQIICRTNKAQKPTTRKSRGLGAATSRVSQTFGVVRNVWRLGKQACKYLLNTICYCTNSLTQAQHAKRTQNLSYLPPYQTERVRAVTREVRDLDKDVSNILQTFNGSFNPSADPATACSLLVNHLCMRRNKRCLLAYHRTRTEKLEELVWNGSDVLETSIAPDRENLGGPNGASADMIVGDGNTSSLSPEEEEYVRQYSDLLAAYKGQWTDIDLTGSLEPPRDLFIDVRVLKDAGEIQTEYGYAGSRSCSVFWGLISYLGPLHSPRIVSFTFDRGM